MSDEILFSRRQFLGGAAGAAVAAAYAELPPALAQAGAKADPSDALFSQNQIPQLRIELGAAEFNELRQNPRAYVHGRMIEDNRMEYPDVAVKLKGAAGSFRQVNDRPALTVNLDKYKKDQSFHALTKIHLNNSVQDTSFLHELLCSEIFLSAGVPAARATHARVWLNDRDLGFYGLKEGFDKTFLKRHFANANGNLYDGGFIQDIEGNLEKDSGDGPDDRSDLKALAQACREPDPARRWGAIDQALDVNAFLTFMALELMTCHWDGYCNNRNNYRVYFNPTSGEAHFFPHGMDQMFGDTGASVLGAPPALVASVVMQNPEWRTRYRARVGELLKIFSPADRLIARIDQAVTRIQPVLAAMNPGAAAGQAARARALKDQVTARAKNLEMQNATGEPKPLQFDSQGVAPLVEWYPRTESEDARHDQAPSPDGVPSYFIACGPSGQCVASWRTKVLLAAGTYKLQARARANDVVARVDAQGAGAGLRVSGGQRTNRLEGATDWRLMEHPIEVGGMQELELIAELRASRGQVWFDAGSMRLIRVSKP
jgi:hypothetical protein